jgi:stearoyl-CoA desaturase (delta-9 desaturase)
MVRLFDAMLWIRPVAPVLGICFMLTKFYSRQELPAAPSAYGLYFLCWLSTIWRLFSHHAGGHRYFSHKSFKCIPLLATLFAITICMGDIVTLYYWVFMHNDHHSSCDVGEDLHSPHRIGFWAVQFNVGDKAKDALEMVKREVGLHAPPNKTLKYKYDADLSWITFPVSIALLFIEPVFWLLIAAPLGYHTADLVLWLCLIPRLVSKHGITATNSFAHTFGPRPYCGNGHAPFPDCLATNCWYIALLNGGEGWHNNHHAFSLSARHGMLWWEVDWCWLGIRLLAELGIVWDVIEVSEEVRLSERDPNKVHEFSQKYVVYYKRGDSEK